MKNWVKTHMQRKNLATLLSLLPLLSIPPMLYALLLGQLTLVVITLGFLAFTAVSLGLYLLNQSSPSSPFSIEEQGQEDMERLKKPTPKLTLIKG